MPAHKRSLEDLPSNDAVNHLQHQQQQQQKDDAVDHDDNHHQQNDNDVDNNEEEEENDDDDGGEVDDADDRSKSSSSDEEDDGDCDGDDGTDDDDEEFILVRLSDIRKEVQCPICLGIIRKTRIVMECLHRFCRECIDKSMRMGNNECPACRTHCASRRSLRDDLNYDAIISTIFQDIDQFEEEELAFQEDERVRNKQIQAAIAHTFRRQTEALSKKRRRSQGNHRRSRNHRSEEEDDANGHDGGKESSSTDERCTEPKSKKPKRWRGQQSPAATVGDGGGDENDQEVQREVGVAPTALVGNAEMLAWGKGGMRSNARYGSGSSGNGKHSRSRIARLSEHLRNLDGNDNEMDIQVMLVSLDQQKEPLLEHNYLCGRPTLSVEQLRQFIALQTSLPPEKLEILAARSLCSKENSLSTTMEVQTSTSTEFEVSKDELEVLDSKETLAGLKAACNFARGRLVLAYREKL